MPISSIRAKFNGIPAEPGIESVEMFGHTFPKGKAVAVPYPSHAAKKIMGNPFFSVRGGDVEDAMLKDDKANVEDLQRVMMIAEAVDAEKQSPTFQIEESNGDNPQKAGPTNAPKAGGISVTGSASPR